MLMARILAGKEARRNRGRIEKSRAEGREGADEDTVLGTAVGDVAFGDDNHAEGRRRHAGRVDLGC